MEQSNDLTVKLFSSLLDATKQIEPFFQSNQNQKQKPKQKQKKLNKQTQQKLVHSQKKIKVLLNKGLNWLNPIETLNLNTSHAQDLSQTQIQNKQSSNKNKNNTNSSNQKNTINSNTLNKKKKQKTRKKNLKHSQFRQLKDFSTILKLNNLIFDHVEHLLGKVLCEENVDNQEEENEKENETRNYQEKGKGRGKEKEKEKENVNVNETEMEKKNDKQNRLNKKNIEQGNVVKFVSYPNYDQSSLSQNQNQNQNQNKNKKQKQKNQELDLNDLFKPKKPQLRFQEQIDNSKKPFQPKLKNKPNCKLPLEQSLLKMKKDGTYNPYSYELNSLQFSAKQYHYYPTTKEIFESKNIKSNISLSGKEFKWVDNEEDLKLVSIQLSKVSRFSLQLYQHQFHSYQGLTCLISISTDSTDYIIDSIKLYGKLGVLLNAFTNPKIIKIMYNSQRSLLALQRDFGLYVINLFDINEAIKLFGEKELQGQNVKLSFIMKKFLNFEENSDKKVNKSKQPNEKNEIVDLMLKEFEEEEDEIKEIEKLKKSQLNDQDYDNHSHNKNNNNNDFLKNFEYIDWRIRPIPFKSLRYLRHYSFYLYNVFEFLKSSLSKQAIHQYSQSNKKLPRNTNKIKQKLIKQVFERGKELCLKGYRKPKFYSKNFFKLYNDYSFNKNENNNKNENYNSNNTNNTNNNTNTNTKNNNSNTNDNNNINNNISSIHNFNDGNEYNKFTSLKLYIFSELYNWRDNIARKEDECIYSILSNKTLFLLCKKLPTTEQSLYSLFPKTKIPIFIQKYSKNIIKILLIKFQDNEIQKRFDTLIEKAYLRLNNNKDGKNENKKLNNTIKGKEEQEERVKGKEKEKEKERKKKKEKEREMEKEKEIEKEKGVDDNNINTMRTELQKIFPKIDSSVIFEISDSEASDSNSEDMRGSSPFFIYSQNNSKGYNSNDLLLEENFKMSGKITPPEQFAPKTQKEIYELSKRNRKRNKENKKKRAQTLIPNPSPLDLLKLHVNDNLESQSMANSENEGNNEKEKYSFHINQKRKNQQKKIENNSSNNNNNNARKRKETIGNNIENTMKFMRTIGWVNGDMEQKLFIYKNQNYNYSHSHDHSYNASINRSKNNNQSNNNINNNRNNNQNNNQNNNTNNNSSSSSNNNNNNNMNINSKQLWNSRIETNLNNTNKNKNKKKNRQRNTNKNWNNDDQYNYFNKNYSHRGSKIHKPEPTRNQFTHDFTNTTNNVTRRNENISSRNFSSNSFSRYDGKTWNPRGRNIHSNRGKSNRNNTNNYGFHD
ncbi:exosome component [Anaeramoeba flamelloides]|uniref:Exosome component n=1 Tax=Anaeramoeba flamelloides TaxID=1746091 RepID=A0AAV7YEM3_9EUKA|nr:exosome component [Anaeramoeba flamelloides]